MKRKLGVGDNKIQRRFVAEGRYLEEESHIHVSLNKTAFFFHTECYTIVIIF